MENKNLWSGLVVVLVIVAGWLIWANFSSGPSSPSEENTEVEVPARNENVGTEDTTAGSINASKPSATISYANALLKYKDARIQLDGLCQASPNTMTFKNGTTIMIDNRSSASRSVKVGSAFNIKAYGFKLVELSSSTLPATWLVDCDKSQNVATVLIQK